ncbi:hypothetical protein EVAR_46024_1 [Eumeta japonica]|uniref:Uncharacterized protein n=1 Tax=Eumeta variegata TaxID=151549 RepID=A0A4C1Z239_EUMVA|nr:hypothetical protein EVAR_46024_1 [Eumeta japonica]
MQRPLEPHQNGDEMSSLDIASISAAVAIKQDGLLEELTTQPDSAHLYKNSNHPQHHVIERTTFVYKDDDPRLSKRERRTQQFSTSITRPHEVLKRGDKIFTNLVNGKQTTVSVERIKPACTIDDELQTLVQAATKQII